MPSPATILSQLSEYRVSIDEPTLNDLEAFINDAETKLLRIREHIDAVEWLNIMMLSRGEWTMPQFNHHFTETTDILRLWVNYSKSLIAIRPEPYGKLHDMVASDEIKLKLRDKSQSGIPHKFDEESIKQSIAAHERGDVIDVRNHLETFSN